MHAGIYVTSVMSMYSYPGEVPELLIRTVLGFAIGWSSSGCTVQRFVRLDHSVVERLRYPIFPATATSTHDMQAFCH